MLTRNLLATGVVAAAFAGSALAATSSSSNSISACVHHQGGGLYSAKHCARHDHRLTWSIQGPQGATGPAGPSTGHAGGDLTGTYPNPSLAAGAVTDGSVSSSARSVAIAGGTVVGGASPSVTTSFNRLGGAVTVTHSSTGVYDISIPGVNYYYSSYITQVTPVEGSLGALSDQTSSVGGDLLVDSYNGAGIPNDSSFSFLVYK